MKFISILSFLILQSQILILTDRSNKPVEKKEEMEFYQADYIKSNYYKILSAGSETREVEKWGIDKDDLDKLPVLDYDRLELKNAVKAAKSHIEKRFAPIELELLDIKLERITKDDLHNDRNWFILISFQSDSRGFVQMQPLLIDGRIILSSNE
jgi:hypothetical protein